jgi:thiol:disulfide interchange protein DsbD
MRMILARFAALFLACSMAAAAPVRTEHVEAELVAAQHSAEPGKPLAAALRLKMIPRWHTYWRNPGDSGEPTRLEWKLPAGYAAGPIRWPAPQRLPAGPLMNFGYEGEVLLPVEIAVPADAREGATLAARATWLVCNDEHCIPEEAQLSLRIAIGPAAASPWARPIAAARAALPVAAGADWRFAAFRTPGGVQLEIQPPSGTVLNSPQFFPFEQGKIHNAGSQAFAGSRLEIPRALQPVGAFNRVAGVLAGGPQALEIDVPVAGVASGVPGLAVALLLAFAGGLILNLMPCVLPVLSIKVLGFAGQGDARALRAHGLVYALGVLVSFWLFAGLLIALQAAGQEIGWGFQLQSPAFVAFLALLFLVLALQLSGIFEFRGFAFTATANHPFLTGVLAVAVASPCTAPFMGAALGYALGETALTALAVFSALGLGMAIPYVALAWHPRWLKWVPKPGAWMVRLKRALAIPLYATVAWLAWVLALQLVVLPAPDRAWKPYSDAALASLTARGKPVFVDFTAAWCVTCQVNKQLVLGRPETERAFAERGVVLLRADWTRRDPEIGRALAALGRNGVPLYVLYSPGQEAVLLPEILTQGAVLAALGRLSRKEPSS